MAGAGAYPGCAADEPEPTAAADATISVGLPGTRVDATRIARQVSRVLYGRARAGGEDRSRGVRGAART